ncbi:PCDH15 [Mytilus edulis]|uniref:PCDH15 n=1 Tax=Mytilus edulis TaxID=6550 RepID=A0A8S3QBT6_MYTED|nr:PCDH15 [Mytilus edulis]
MRLQLKSAFNESRDIIMSCSGHHEINIQLEEATLEDISSNPDKYTADTHINGIPNGTDSSTGIILQIQGTSGSQIDVNSLFVLESKPIPISQNGYTRRTFIRLNAPLDRDGRSYEPNDDLNNIQFTLKCTRLIDSVSKYFTVNVEIIDVNDNYPQILGNPRPISVNEDLAQVISERRTSTVTMTIDVRDGDDLGPVFDYQGCFRVDNACFNPTYTTDISHHSTASQLILRAAEDQSIIDSIKARDQDTLNARIQLSIVETLSPGYKDRFALFSSTNNGTLSSATVSQIKPIGPDDVNILKIIIKATELTNNRRFNRAVIDVHIRQSNISCSEKVTTTKPCSNGALIVGAVLGTLLAIVITIVIALIMKQRKQGDREIVTPEQRTPAHQNEGFSNGNTIQSRQTSRKYDEIGMQSPDNVYDELHNDQYLEPI